MTTKAIKKKVEIKMQKEDQSSSELKTKSVAELKDILRLHGLYMKGTKGELIERIKNCIPFPEYEPPTDYVNYADDHKCGINRKRFFLKRAPTSAATCRRCLVQIEQGRTKISFLHQRYLVATGCSVDAEQSFHIECFCRWPPVGIAQFEDVDLNTQANANHVVALREQFERRNHDRGLKFTPRAGGAQEYRLSLKAAGKHVNGKDKGSRVFMDDLEFE